MFSGISFMYSWVSDMWCRDICSGSEHSKMGIKRLIPLLPWCFSKRTHQHPTYWKGRRCSGIPVYHNHVDPRMRVTCYGGHTAVPIRHPYILTNPDYPFLRHSRVAATGSCHYIHTWILRYIGSVTLKLSNLEFTFFTGLCFLSPENTLNVLFAQRIERQY